MNVKACRPVDDFARNIASRSNWSETDASALIAEYEDAKGITVESVDQLDDVMNFFPEIKEFNKNNIENAFNNLPTTIANLHKEALNELTYRKYRILKNYIGKIISEFGTLSAQMANDPNVNSSLNIMGKLLNNQRYKTDMEDIIGTTKFSYEELSTSIPKQILYNLACNYIISNAIRSGDLSINEFMTEVLKAFRYKVQNIPYNGTTQEIINMFNDLKGSKLVDTFMAVTRIASYDFEKQTGIELRQQDRNYDTALEDLKEETLLENWMQNVDKSSTFGRASAFTRLLCGLIPQYTLYIEIGSDRAFQKDIEVVDGTDVSFRKNWDPKKLHDLIQVHMRGVCSADDMIRALSTSDNVSLKLVATLASMSDKVKGALFKDAYSFYQEYASNKVSRKNNERPRSYINRLTGGKFAIKTIGALKSWIGRRLKGKSGYLSDNSIFKISEHTELTKKPIVVDLDRLRNFVNKMYSKEVPYRDKNDNLVTPEAALYRDPNTGNILYAGGGELSKDKLTSTTKRDVVIELIRYLNDSLSLNMTKKTIENLVSTNITDYQRLLHQVYNFCKLSSEELSKYENTKELKYDQFFLKGNKENTTTEAIRDCYETMLNIAAQANDTNAMMVRENKSKSNYAKDAKTSDFGRQINQFRSFLDRLNNVESGNSAKVSTGVNRSTIESKRSILAEMREFLLSEYLTSSEFYVDAPISITKDGKSVDYHIKDFINSDFFIQLAKKDEANETEIIDKISNNITHDWVRLLFKITASNFNSNSILNHICESGEKIMSSDIYSEVLTEDMNIKFNVCTFINSFTREGCVGDNIQYAYYAMPTMGDAEVIRSMKGCVYQMEDLMNIFCNVAESEIARMLQKQRVFEQYGEQGVEEITSGKSSFIIDENSESNIDESMIGDFVYLKCLNKYKKLFIKQGIFYVKPEVDPDTHAETKHITYNSSEFRNLVKQILFNNNIDELFKEFSSEFVDNLRKDCPTIFDTVECPVDVEDSSTIETNTQSKTQTFFKNIPDIPYDRVFRKNAEGKEELLSGKEKANNELFLYYLNHKLAIIQQLQFLHKSPDAYVDKELTPSSVVHQKRFKAENTPGDPLNPSRKFNGESMPEFQKVMYITEHTQSLKDYDPETYNNLFKRFKQEALKEDNSISDEEASKIAEEKLKAYTKIKTTDGQGWRTLPSYRRLRIMNETWTGRDELVYNEIQKIRNGYDVGEGTNKKHIDGIKELLAKEYLTLEEKRTISKLQGELDRLASNLNTSTKPHLSTFEKIAIKGSNRVISEMYIPVEHKYAETILIPELYGKDNFLYHLGTHMENNNIDMACSEECVKVGKWGMVTVPQSSTDASVFSNAFKNATIHSFRSADVEIQTEVPPHMDTDQLMGTQMRKHILATIIKNGAYNLYSATLGGQLGKVRIGDKVIDLTDPEHGGENLTKLYNTLVSKKFLDSFLAQADVLEDPVKLSDALSLIESRGALSSVNSLSRFSTSTDAVTGKIKFDIPLNELSRLFDNETSIMSMFSRKVNKQKMRGGSLVQVSAIGFPDLKTRWENGVPTSCDMAATWDGSIMINGREVKLKYEDWVNYDGTLIMDNDESGEAVSLPVFQKAGRYNITNDPFIDFKDLKGYRHQVEVVYPEKNNKNKVRIYIKNNGEVIEGKGYFEIIKDPEENDYSIYFKTGDANTGELFGSTKEERAILYEVAAKLLPNGAKLSTIASKEKGITKGGLIGLNKIGSMEGFSTTNEVREGFMRGKAISKLDKAYPGFTDRVLYRIPTEKSYSIFSAKITRFLPSYVGNIVSLPSEYMTAAGFDFDIDKLYYLKREYHIKYNTIEDGTIEKEDTDPLVMDIWNTIYSRKGKLGKTIGEDLRAVKITSDKAYYTERNKYVNEVINIINKKYKDNKKLNSSEEELLTNLQEHLSKDLSEYNLKNKEDEKIINNALFVAFKDKIKRDIDNGQSTLVIPSSKLYPYWSKIYLNSTYQEAFDDYLIKHPDKAKRLNEAQRNNRLLEKKGVESLTLTHKERQAVHPLQDTQGTNTEDINLGDLSSWELDNMLFDIIKSRIEDPATIIDRYTPGGFPTGKEAAKKLKAIKNSSDFDDSLLTIENAEITKDYEPKYDLTNPFTTAIYNARNIIAKKVIGIAANHSTNYAYSKTLGSVTLSTPITLFDKSLNDLNCKEGGWMLAEFLAASVDAVKEPVLNFLNINSTTASIAMLLGRAGFNMFEIGVFLNQPIIQKVIDRSSEYPGRLALQIRKVAEEELGITTLSSEMHNISKKDLLQNLKRDPKNKDNKKLQQAILSTFAKLNEQANELDLFVRRTKYTASNSVDNTIGSSVAAYYAMVEDSKRAENNVNRELNITLNDGTPLSNVITTSIPEKIGEGGEVTEYGSILNFMRDKKAYLDNLLNNPLAMEQCMFDCVRGILDITKNYFPYTTPLYDNAYKILFDNSLYGELDSDIIGRFNKGLAFSLMALPSTSRFNPNAEVYYNYTTKTISLTPPTIPNAESDIEYCVFPKAIDLYGERGALNTSNAEGSLGSLQWFILDKNGNTTKSLNPERNDARNNKLQNIQTSISYVIGELQKVIKLSKTIHEYDSTINSSQFLNNPNTSEEYKTDIWNTAIDAIEGIKIEMNEILGNLFDKSIWFRKLPETSLTDPNANPRADYIANVRKLIISGNSFLEALSTEYGFRVSNGTEVYDNASFVIDGGLQFDKDISPDLIEAWSEVHNVMPTFSEALYLTNYFTRGFSIGRNNFNNLAPSNLISGLQVTEGAGGYNYISFLNQLNRGEGPSATAMGDATILANMFCNFYRILNDVRSLVPSVSNSTEVLKRTGNKIIYTDPNGEQITMEKGILSKDCFGKQDYTYTISIPASSVFSIGIHTGVNSDTNAPKVPTKDVLIEGFNFGNNTKEQSLSTGNKDANTLKQVYIKTVPAFVMSVPEVNEVTNVTIYKKYIFVNKNILNTNVKAEKEIITDASNNRQEKLVGKAEYVPFELATVETDYGTQSDVFSSYKGVQLNDIDRMSGANLGENVSIDNMTGIDAYREVRNNSVEATLLKLERLSNKKNFDEAKNEDGRPFCGK